MDDYEKLLDNAITKLPKISYDHQRFEIPRVRGRFEGNKTIINNFSTIASTLRRPDNVLIKYLSRTLAVPMEYDGTRLSIKGRILPQRVNEKILEFAKLYVVCDECGKPDTNMIEEDGIYYIRCMACGEKKVVKNYELLLKG